MKENSTYITKEGLVKLKNELKELKTLKRKEIAARIQEAKELGDLSENAEYAEAKNEQAFIEGRIAELDNILKNVTIIEPKKGKNSGVVDVGSTVKVKNNGETTTFTIVGPSEINLAEGKISHDSPLGRAFIGRKIGETVEIKVPEGLKKFEIITIS